MAKREFTLCCRIFCTCSGDGEGCILVNCCIRDWMASNCSVGFSIELERLLTAELVKLPIGPGNPTYKNERCLLNHLVHLLNWEIIQDCVSLAIDSEMKNYLCTKRKLLQIIIFEN